MQQPVIIRKYPNRRLYDTASRRYVNLDDLAAMIRKGTEIQVVDAKTGDDLTRVILTQVIVEDAKDQPTGLPLELLRQLIMASDRAGQEFLMWYLNSAFEAYEKVQKTALSPIQMVKSFLSGDEKPAGEGELDRLRRRIAELEALVQKPQKPQRAKNAKPRRGKSSSDDAIR
ncbi:PHA accumulation regulator DNA-binding protein [Candidatus Sulfopaludibacter sp. SbA3]|nr:PHA accumulation regulator DNA-binding protein [Candidatus Sulfopaludibacter sp. SbA3]